MRLVELDPRLVRYETREEPVEVVQGDEATWRDRGCPTNTVVKPVQHIIIVPTLAEAQGLWFLCPKCFVANKGAIGTHQVDVAFEGRGALGDKGRMGWGGIPTRWELTGTGLQDLTLRPSILLVGGCAWHGYITNGEVQ